ncbi:hypothetical protein BHE74_00010625 [Ensete ventricosum]|nr:hypothetical protein GW17_00034286 [Ensete ventricosum]RWW81009.1 hypothetical protein BHE74_00010625 [Ensete ventricosum]RZS01946.1 hypothetical protein BHM03_00031907 [Ensete ventricosum]
MTSQVPLRLKGCLGLYACCSLSKPSSSLDEKAFVALEAMVRIWNEPQGDEIDVHGTSSTSRTFFGVHRSNRKGLPPAASPATSRGGAAGYRGGRPLAGWLPIAKDNRRLHRGSGDDGAMRVEG